MYFLSIQLLTDIQFLAFTDTKVTNMVEEMSYSSIYLRVVYLDVEVDLRQAC